MSVTLENIRVAGAAGQPLLFDGLSLHIGDHGRVGILGTAKSGKSTLLRLICGTKRPDEGTARRDGRISWPIPLATFFAGGHSVARNVRFIARLYGIDDEDFPRRIAELVDLTEFLNTPLAKCPRTARPRLAFALGVGVDFDLYLFDGSFGAADRPFKERAAEISAARTAGRAIVIATSLPAEVEQNCESVYVLEQGRATFFAEASQGIERFKELAAAEKKKDRPGAARREVSEDEDEGPSDIDMLGTGIAGVIE